MIWDYKTKWEWYDLRISVAGTGQMHNLADAIEGKFYSDGQAEEAKKAVYDSMGTNFDPNMGRAEQYYNETYGKSI